MLRRDSHGYKLRSDVMAHGRVVCPNAQHLLLIQIEIDASDGGWHGKARNS
jgi:hypothetical protein